LGIVEVIRKGVRKDCERKAYLSVFFDEHIVPVAEFAKTLAKRLGADEEVCEVAGLLHDIGIIFSGHKDHNISGAKEAELLLSELKYPQRKIDKVIHCIVAHSGGVKRETLEANCVYYADNMAVIDRFPFTHSRFLREIKDSSEALRRTKEEIENAWAVLPKEAKKLVKEKYEEAKEFLG
jgi:putative nucleotidyltransferase with HDIG domain